MPRRPRRESPPPPAATPLGPFRLGVMPGATPGRWVDTWRERTPNASLTLIELALNATRHALDAGEVDAAIVRLPIRADGLHVIPLYGEDPVVVFPADARYAAADTLTLGDLAGETLIVARDDVLGLEASGTVPPRFAPPEDTAAAVALVAAGTGVMVVPASLARAHQRRDVDRRPLADGPVSRVALAWPAAATTPEVEAFVGIVRGRTAQSSRS